jgi:hypothetical protein
MGRGGVFPFCVFIFCSFLLVISSIVFPFPSRFFFVGFLVWEGRLNAAFMRGNDARIHRLVSICGGCFVHHVFCSFLFPRCVHRYHFFLYNFFFFRSHRYCHEPFPRSSCPAIVNARSSSLSARPYGLNAAVLKAALRPRPVVSLSPALPTISLVCLFLLPAFDLWESCYCLLSIRRSNLFFFFFQVAIMSFLFYVMSSLHWNHSRASQK